VKCERCGRELSTDDNYQHLGETLCEDCYIDIRYPAKACDPWAVLEVLHESDGHITAMDIYERARAKYPPVNKSTVYRTLELMKELRLITETDLGGGRLCYHHAEKGYHHHLICEKCGRVIDLDEASGNFRALL
jgi:hypothetical protein